jgi:hypothetical protein
MNEEQTTELLKQITRIADYLECIYESDQGSITGIESALWQLDLAIRGKEDSE